MGKTPGISGMLVLKSLSCRASCEPLDFLCEKITPCLFQRLSVPLSPAVLDIAKGHTTNLRVTPEL